MANMSASIVNFARRFRNLAVRLFARNMVSVNEYDKFKGSLKGSLGSGECYVPIPGKENPSLYTDQLNVHHLIRYTWASKVLEGRSIERLLDAACGCGYGSAFLAPLCRRYIGIDYQPEHVQYARRVYGRDNTEFLECNVSDIESRFEESSFDVVVSFDTLEHIKDGRGFITAVRRLLKEDGLFLLASPTREDAVSDPENVFHVYEFSNKELEEMITANFKSYRVNRELPLINVFDEVNERLGEAFYHAVWNPVYCYDPIKD